MLKSAILGGANAVYLGLSKFNARNSLDYISEENFTDIISYAHIRNVLVYVTFNTIIKEREFSEATKLIDFIIQNGADAIILQDFGIFNYIKNAYPTFPIHISTQVGICNLNGVKLMEQLGAKRVVLARETPFSEIKRIKENTNIEIEYFVQGALCVSYSGNCYFSSIVDGNSGNRGNCKQPCRKKMRLKGDFGTFDGYNLSTYDTCLLTQINQLAEIGVDSLKIEGRLRSPEYVYSACQCYNKAINKVDYSVSLENLKTAYNRGNYSSAYFQGRKSKVIYNKVQGNIGRDIGVVTKKIDNKFLVKSDYIPNKKDGFKILRNEIEVCGAIINKNCNISANHFEIVGKDIRVGDIVRLTYSDKLNNEAISNELKVPVDIKYYISNKSIIITCKLYNKEYSFSSFQTPEIAQNQPLDELSFQSQFNKFNDSPFYINEISGKVEDGLFYPKSIINNIRREFINKIINAYLDDTYNKHLKSECVALANKEHFIENIVILNKVYNNDKLKKFTFVYRPYDYKTLEDCNFTNYYLYIPNYYSANDEKVLLSLLKEKQFKGVYCDGYSAIKLAIDNNLPYIMGVNCNITNYASLQLFNCSGFVNSKELNLQETLTGGVTLCKGDYTIMTLVHCPLVNGNICNCDNCKYSPFKYIDDGKREFNIKRNKIDGCLFSLLNNAKINCNGINKKLYDFSFLSNDEIDKILNDDNSIIYNKGHLYRGIS